MHCSRLIYSLVISTYINYCCLSIVYVPSTNKTNPHDIAEMLLKVALNTINQTIHCTWVVINPSVWYRLSPINIQTSIDILYSELSIKHGYKFLQCRI
jgi:hypothetical protein